MSTVTAVGIAIGAGIATAVLLILLTCGGCVGPMLIRTISPEGEPNTFVMPKGTTLTTPCGDRYRLADDGILTALERSKTQ